MPARQIGYARQSVDESDIAAVSEVLRSDFLTQGPVVAQFERAVAAYVEAPHAVAVSSATAALHLACLALDLDDGDVAWTSANTFVASANCARYCGARVDFVDIDPASGNLAVGELERKLAATPRAELPKILVAVHYGGLPCDMQALAVLARRYGFSIVEDASQALGATLSGERVGGCTHAAMTIFSFHAIKGITTGEGGMIVTRDADTSGRLRRLRSHGVTRDAEDWHAAGEGPWYYEMQELGFNYRLTDFQSALGISQLRRLPEFLERRERLAAEYERALRGLGLQAPSVPADRTSAWHLYPVSLLGPDGPRLRERVFLALRAAGIGVNVHYIPVPMHPYYARLGASTETVPNAVDHYRRTLSLPMHPALTDEEQAYVVRELARALE